LLSSKWFRGGGRELLAEVGLAEGAEANAGRAQAVQPAAEAHFVAHATDDEERVFVIGGEESPCGFQTSVTGLHHLLRVGQVPADEDVDVGSLVNLVERHEEPPFARTTDCVRWDLNPHDSF
jgi:hypothetical protein